MFCAPERLSALGAFTFSIVITTSKVQDLNEKKLLAVDYPTRTTYMNRIRAEFMINFSTVSDRVTRPKGCMFLFSGEF
jgi:hypothetical protein